MPMEQERKINHNIIVECKDVSKTFITPEGEHPVVRNFDLEAKENEFLVLFGPGQCGKTTIINMIAGFEKATAGSMKFMGKRLLSQILPEELCFSRQHYFPG